MFPHMTELFAAGENESFKKNFSGCIRKLSPILLPATAGLIVLAEPVIRIAFQRGLFTPEDTRRTAECLRMYALLCLPTCVSPVLTRGFYAMRNTKIPAVISAVSVGVNVIFNFALIGPLQHSGLALATAVASAATMLMLLLMLRRTLGPLGLRSSLRELGKAVLATAVMTAAVILGFRLLPVMSGGTVQCIALTAALALSGAVLYAALHFILRSEIFKEMKKQTNNLLKLASKTPRG
jgi:putative peptidoglycan lipid II flippase